jgi:hypothetical protein
MEFMLIEATLLPPANKRSGELILGVLNLLGVKGHLVEIYIPYPAFLMYPELFIVKYILTCFPFFLNYIFLNFERKSLS